MPPSLLAIVVDCHDSLSQANFWAAALGHQVSERNPHEYEVARLVAAGGTLVEMRQDPATLVNPDRWAVLQDPEGNEFCVLNADSVTGMA